MRNTIYILKGGMWDERNKKGTFCIHTIIPLMEVTQERISERDFINFVDVIERCF
jgi:hypothetical protein